MKRNEVTTKQEVAVDPNPHGDKQKQQPQQQQRALAGVYAAAGTATDPPTTIKEVKITPRKSRYDLAHSPKYIPAHAGVHSQGRSWHKVKGDLQGLEFNEDKLRVSTDYPHGGTFTQHQDDDDDDGILKHPAQHFTDLYDDDGQAAKARHNRDDDDPHHTPHSNLDDDVRSDCCWL